MRFKAWTLVFAIAFVLLSGAALAQEAGILTPPPSPKPHINGPSVFGVRPSHPFFYRIPATGDRPMTFSAKELPPGLKIDTKAGIIRGAVEKRGTYTVTLEAHNALGDAEKRFRIVVGDKIALTPPMGWSTWYANYTKISAKLVRAEARAMISSGLANYGYSYINIDDGWDIKPSSKDPAIGGAPRDAKGNILPNRNFPEMKALVDFVHSKGLRTGIYTSPGPLTCGGFEGSYGHEAQDARQFAAWGFDFVKYDLCSYRKLMKDTHDPAELKPPYRKMGADLRKQDRDMVFNLCEYGLGDVWKWGREVGGNMWRTAGDVGAQPRGVPRPLWYNLSRFGFGQADMAKFAGPGGWNDPDNLLLGRIFWKGKLQPTPLTHNEQYTYVTLWSLMSAPLIIGGDLRTLDLFTLSLLENPDVIAVDQDALGKQAVPVAQHGDLEVWAKDMEDGSKAVGFFNRGDHAATVTVDWKQLGIHGKHRVRDLWREKDLGVYDGSFQASVGPHGAEMFLVKSHNRSSIY